MVASALHQTSAAALQVGVETSVKSVSPTTWKKTSYYIVNTCYIVEFLILAAVCNPPCENGGRCTSPGRCECTSNYRGPQCQDGMRLSLSILSLSHSSSYLTLSFLPSPFLRSYLCSTLFEWRRVHEQWIVCLPQWVDRKTMWTG